ncbi:unnamed protein product, partial [Gulo gulo]
MGLLGSSYLLHPKRGGWRFSCSTGHWSPWPPSLGCWQQWLFLISHKFFRASCCSLKTQNLPKECTLSGVS